jgi:uncharacterized protein YycO
MKKHSITAFVFEIIGSVVMCIFSYLFINASIQNICMLEEMKEFVSHAELELEVGNVSYYAVYTDDVLDRRTITIVQDENDNYRRPLLGTTGDIFIMPQSRMEFFPLSSQIISYMFGGHAGVVVENGTHLVEAMGGYGDYADIASNYTDLFDEERTVVGLRVKAPYYDRFDAAEFAKGLIGEKYNYLFIFNTKNKYYCTDICSRIYSSEFGLDYKIDENGFYTSVPDLLLSNDTEISFVKYTKGDKVYIYYLKSRNL